MEQNVTNNAAGGQPENTNGQPENTSGIDMAMDVVNDLMEAADYENPVSSVFATLGDMFHSMFPNAIGEFLQKAMRNVADKLDKATHTNMDARTQAHRMLAGGEFTDATREVADVVGMDPDAFAKDLSAAAGMLSSGSGPADGTRNQVMDIGAAISGSAQAYPAATAQALQTFSSVGEAWLSEHGSNYPDAEANLRSVNKAMAEYYYESVMQAEASGLALSEADRAALAGFSMYGVDTTYEEFVEAHGGKMAEQQGNKHVVRSDGSLEAGIGLDAGSIREAAEADVNSGAMADHREDMDSVAGWKASTEETVAGIRESGPEGMGDAYMARIAEMQAYNDAAVSAIMAKYANDPEGRLAAETGLAMRMQAGMGPLFDAMKEDQEAHGCFSREQLDQLAELKLTGVSVSYEDYMHGTGLMPAEDESLYANAYEDTAGQGAFKTDWTVPGAEAGAAQPAAETAVKKKSYGDMAAGKFDGIMAENGGAEYSM